MDFLSELTEAIRRTRMTRTAAGVSRESAAADRAYAQSVENLCLRKDFLGIEVNLNGEKIYVHPDDVTFIYS